MPILPESPNDQIDENWTPAKSPSDERASIEPFPIRVRIVSDGTGDVEILRGAEPPIVLHLPPAVAEIVALEIPSSGQIQKPADDLAQKYREWEDGTSCEVQARGKGSATCFENSCGVPDLLFWILEHFSDVDFPLNESQKYDLTFHTFEEAASIRGCHVSELMSTETTDSLEYCWYFLVRLLAVEADLAAGDPSTPTAQRHLELIRCHYSLLLNDLSQFHELGWITTASPKEDIEAKLIDLATSQPNLKPVVTQIIRNWDALEEDADRLHNLSESRSHRLDGDPPSKAVDTDGDIPLTVQKQRRVMSQIRCLEQLMTPGSDDDPTWHHPLEYIEGRAEGRHVLFVKPGIAVFRGDDFSNGQKLEFMLMEHMAGCGFCHWLYPEAEIHLHFIHEWLKHEGDSRSLKAIAEPVQQYLTWPAGRARPSLRDLLGFPKALEPVEVTQEIQFWEEVWTLREGVAAEVRLYMAQNENERRDAMEWMQASDDKRFIVIGDAGAFQGYSYACGCTTRDTSLLIQHRMAVPDYEWSLDEFTLFRALNFAAFEVGRKRGWGVHQSAALPIKDNGRFLEAFASGDLRQASVALFAQFHVTTSGGYIDAAIFTAENDRIEEDSLTEPLDVDAGAHPSAARC